MVMNAKDFVARFKQIKTYLDGHADASAELRESYEKLNQAFKGAFSPEALKAALADNTSIDNDLEERLTSTQMLMNQDRARRSG
jgi:hypothetical protein